MLGFGFAGGVVVADGGGAVGEDVLEAALPREGGAGFVGGGWRVAFLGEEVLVPLVGPGLGGDGHPIIVDEAAGDAVGREVAGAGGGVIGFGRDGGIEHEVVVDGGIVVLQRGGDDHVPEAVRHYAFLRVAGQGGLREGGIEAACGLEGIADIAVVIRHAKLFVALPRDAAEVRVEPRLPQPFEDGVEPSFGIAFRDAVAVDEGNHFVETCYHFTDKVY